jgi:hypothetical protein
MGDLRADPACEADQSTEVEQVIALKMKAIEGGICRVAESIVLKRDDELLGLGEFDLREKVLEMDCHMPEATVNDRKKGGIKAPARSVSTVVRTPDSSSGAARRW